MTTLRDEGLHPDLIITRKQSDNAQVGKMLPDIVEERKISHPAHIGIHQQGIRRARRQGRREPFRTGMDTHTRSFRIRFNQQLQQVAQRIPFNEDHHPPRGGGGGGRGGDDC